MFQNVPWCSYNKTLGHVLLNKMKTKLLAIALLLMLLSAPLAQVVYAEDATGGGDTGDGDNGDGDDGGGGNIDPLVYQQIKEDTEARWWNLYYLYTGQQGGEDDGDGDGGDGGTGEYDGPEIPEDLDPELRNQLMNAWMEMNQAAEMEGENLQTAAQQHLRVMRTLRNTWRKYQKDNPGVVDDPPEPPEGTGEGGDELPPEPTEEELTEIQEQLVNRFQERFRESVTEMFQFYNEVEDDLGPDDAMKAYNALYHAEQKLLHIQERIAAGDIEGAIDDLEGAGNDLDEGFDDMDPQSAQLVKTVLKLKIKIARAAGDDDLVNELKGKIDKAKNEYKENKGKGNDNANGNGNGNGKDKDTEKKPKKEKD
jgi:hypothetical protein